MTFDTYDRSLQLLRALAVLLKRLASHDADLTKQLRRAGASVALNIAEANQRVGKDRTHLFRVALGSAAEVTACLEVAVALDYLAHADVAAALELADRVRALTYRLARR
ncbi:MAG TPA: four helix bundle protein [Kofleriaceae bacterium]|nr:four helix bundle protein [Kofleriaceae bacterium]